MSQNRHIPFLTFFLVVAINLLPQQTYYYTKNQYFFISMYNSPDDFYSNDLPGVIGQ